MKYYWPNYISTDRMRVNGRAAMNFYNHNKLRLKTKQFQGGEESAMSLQDRGVEAIVFDKDI